MRYPPGCIALGALLAVFVLLPFLIANVALAALAKLGLSPGASFAVAASIVLGAAINIPVRRIPREQPVTTVPIRVFGIDRVLALPTQERAYMTLAVNVGGCVVPCGLAVYEMVRIAEQGPDLIGAALAATALNTGVCWWMATPVPDRGIALPAFVPALVAAVSALILAPDMAPPVAFVAGVLGTLIGADLLHLGAIEEIATDVASIGGAGTFDGIVLSGLIATLLA
jgi:uncharacterized membrane protein